MGEVKAAGEFRQNLSPEKKRQLIAIDGPAASGKSSVGKRLADVLGIPFLDTGAMYRAVTWIALNRHVDIGDEDALGRMAASLKIDLEAGRDATESSKVLVDGLDVTPWLQIEEVEASVSLVSKAPRLREELVRAQRALASRQPVVMAGRDIGTVVLPDAHWKVYLSASLEERARRRCRESREAGHELPYESVLEGLRERDEVDASRSAGPMRPAQDAIVIDTDGLTLDRVVDRVLHLVGHGR